VSLLVLHDINHKTNFYNLGQNKKEQLTPLPPKAMMKAQRSKNAPFWHHCNGGGRGGPDFPFILSKIVGTEPEVLCYGLN